ncbi:MAG: glycosyltransferase family 2 protein [Mucilaginibacter sp.]|uniref:glycosyltransferase family 2 protein n=1 Tax=Mucilaginibacter sp. TaxID=1882438 RepID=UPI0031B05732
MEPLITVVTPSYNQGQFIEETILSVLNQTYKNIQYIIVDGGSTDQTMEVVNRYKDRIDIIIHEKDKGQSDAINKGFRLAKGELTGWINSDDILYPDCIEQIVKLYNKNNDGSIYYGGIIEYIDKDSKSIKLRNGVIGDKSYLLKENYDVIQQGSFYSVKILKQVNYVNEAIHYCMDLDLWLRLLNYGPIYSYNEKPIAGFRKWEGTKTATSALKFLNDIKITLLKNGAPAYGKTLRKIYYYTFKAQVKRLFVKYHLISQ